MLCAEEVVCQWDGLNGRQLVGGVVYPNAASDGTTSEGRRCPEPKCLLMAAIGALAGGVVCRSSGLSMGRVEW